MKDLHLLEIITKYSFHKRGVNASIAVSDVESYSNLKLPEDFMFTIWKTILESINLLALNL